MHTLDMYSQPCVCGFCIHGFHTDGKYFFKCYVIADVYCVVRPSVGWLCLS